MYNIALSDCNNRYSNWVSNVKKLLNDYGFSYVFDHVNGLDKEVFVREFKRRLIDTLKQEWYECVDKCTVMYLYKNVKQYYEYENYLDIIPRCYRFYFVD